MEIKGFKVFNSDWTCRGFKFEVGNTYKHEGNIEMCGKGFHFCQKASDCFNYYGFDSKNKVAEVQAIGLVETANDKSVTNEIVIVREITWQEVLTIVNEGKDCTGLWNTGNRNTGDWNTGNWNTGNWNTGNWNTGNWNTGNWNTGFFSTITPKAFLFEKETELRHESIYNLPGMEVLNWHYENNWWIYSEAMTEEEKTAFPWYETTGGYLKSVSFKDACELMWGNLDDGEKQKVLDLPNFDPTIFEKVTGIKVEVNNE